MADEGDKADCDCRHDCQRPLVVAVRQVALEPHHRPADLRLHSRHFVPSHDFQRWRQRRQRHGRGIGDRVSGILDRRPRKMGPREVRLSERCGERLHDRLIAPGIHRCRRAAGDADVLPFELSFKKDVHACDLDRAGIDERRTHVECLPGNDGRHRHRPGSEWTWSVRGPFGLRYPGQADPKRGVNRFSDLPFLHHQGGLDVEMLVLLDYRRGHGCECRRQRRNGRRWIGERERRNRILDARIERGQRADRHGRRSVAKRAIEPGNRRVDAVEERLLRGQAPRSQAPPRDAGSRTRTARAARQSGRCSEIVES